MLGTCEKDAVEGREGSWKRGRQGLCVWCIGEVSGKGRGGSAGERRERKNKYAWTMYVGGVGQVKGSEGREREIGEKDCACLGCRRAEDERREWRTTKGIGRKNTPDLCMLEVKERQK